MASTPHPTNRQRAVRVCVCALSSCRVRGLPKRCFYPLVFLRSPSVFLRDVPVMPRSWSPLDCSDVSGGLCLFVYESWKPKSIPHPPIFLIVSFASELLLLTMCSLFCVGLFFSAAWRDAVLSGDACFLLIRFALVQAAIIARNGKGCQGDAV